MSERLNRAWIETKLSLRERNTLFDAILEETSAPTGEQILAKIAELFPKKKNLPSVRAINKWKANRWEFAVCADPESFFRGAVCLYFRHLKIPVLSAVYSVRAALL